jgi:hypothetical protein
MSNNRKTGKSERQREKEREHLQGVLIAYVFIIIILIMAVLMIIGSNSPQGLTGFFNEIKTGIFEGLKNLRFKLDIYFRFIKSIFA